MADDLSRRREKRRRNILENSEIRLKRLLGENVHLKNAEDAVGLDSDDLSKAFLSKNISEIYTNETNNDDLGSYSAEKDELSTREYSSPSLNIKKVVVEKAKVEESENTSNLRSMPENSAFATPGDASFASESVQTYSNELSLDGIIIGKKSTKETCISPVWVYYPIIKKLAYAAFAMMLHLLLFFDVLNVLIGRSIFIPFISLETAFFSFEAVLVPSAALTNFRVSHGLLNGALLLSGVPQRIIIVLSKVFSFIERLWEEFSIYLFTFLIMHWFLEVKAE